MVISIADAEIHGGRGTEPGAHQEEGNMLEDLRTLANELGHAKTGTSLQGSLGRDVRGP
jgi:hypothetical protein